MNGTDSVARFVDELREMNAEYAKAVADSGADLSNVKAREKELNFEANMVFLDDLLSGIQDSANRTTDIGEQLRSFSGTGLGLDICKKILEAHNGRMECEESSGGGTAFAVPVSITG